MGQTLDGRVALVTGASRGIGKDIALLFAAEGARVVCAARTLREGDHQLEGAVETTVEEIRAAGGQAEPVAANIADEEECERLVREARAAFGAIDVLVNNAAMNLFAATAEIEPRRWKRAFDVNVHAPFLLARAVLPEMIERGRGAIVNISSGSATGPGRGPYGGQQPGQAVLYGATKAALERLTQGLAEELYEHGITVAAVAPSQVVLTPGALFHQGSWEFTGDSEPGEYMARAALLLAAEPLDRVTGRVGYSQQLLAEFGLLEEPHGTGVDRPGSGYALQ